MREPNVQVELTSKEVMLNAEAIYLAALCVANPEKVQGDIGALNAVIDILESKEEWLSYLTKMQNICILAQTKKGC